MKAKNCWISVCIHKLIQRPQQFISASFITFFLSPQEERNPQTHFKMVFNQVYLSIVKSRPHCSRSWGSSSSLDCLTVIPLAKTASRRNLHGCEHKKKETKDRILLNTKLPLFMLCDQSHPPGKKISRRFLINKAGSEFIEVGSN